MRKKTSPKKAHRVADIKTDELRHPSHDQGKMKNVEDTGGDMEKLTSLPPPEEITVPKSDNLEKATATPPQPEMATTPQEQTVTTAATTEENSTGKPEPAPETSLSGSGHITDNPLQSNNSDELKEPPIVIVPPDEGSATTSTKPDTSAPHTDGGKSDTGKEKQAVDVPPPAGMMDDGKQPQSSNLADRQAYFLTDKIPIERKNNLFLMGVLVAGAAILSFIGVYALFSSKAANKSESSSAPAAPTVASSEVSVQNTPTPAIDRKSWVFEVLNGSGQSGMAAKAAGKLTSMGYSVSKTGNADKNNYPQSIIFVSKEKADKVQAILEDIKDQIPIASVAGTITEKGVDVRLIIGKE